MRLWALILRQFDLFLIKICQGQSEELPCLCYRQLELRGMQDHHCHNRDQDNDLRTLHWPIEQPSFSKFCATQSSAYHSTAMHSQFAMISQMRHLIVYSWPCFHSCLHAAITGKLWSNIGSIVLAGMTRICADHRWSSYTIAKHPPSKIFKYSRIGRERKWILQNHCDWRNWRIIGSHDDCHLCP